MKHSLVKRLRASTRRGGREKFAAIATLLCVGLVRSAFAATVSITFEASDDPRVVPGAEATNLFVTQGVRFPSRPTIERDFGNRVLQQGRPGTRPDPLPEPITCAPLEMEFSAAMGVREVRLRVINRHLRAYHVQAYAGSAEVDAHEFIPRGEGPRFPFPARDSEITLRAQADEGDITRIVASPPSDCFDLMVIDDLRVTTARDVVPIDPVPPPATPNVISVLAYEVTQGVMPRLTRPEGRFETSPDTGLMVLPAKQLSFVEGRNTAVRFFLGASERTVEDFNGSLAITVIYRDGTVRTKTITENTEGGRVAPRTAVDDVRLLRRLLALRRARVNQSLDYVIPGAFLENARSMTLFLRRLDIDVAMVRVNVPFKGPYKLGLNVFRVRDPSVGLTPTRVATRLMLQYLKDLYPVSGDIALREAGVLPIDRSVDTTCDAVLGTLSGLAAGTSGGTALPDVNYWSNVFIARNPPGCLGYGYYNSPGALTNRAPSVAAQEISHNIGINHASNQHGESAGGARGDWESWPYGHGSIGMIDELVGFRDGVFGVVLRPNAASAGLDMREEFGVWTIGPVAPCQATDFPTLFPTCSAGDANVVHDYMSYGPVAPIPVWGNSMWISDVNYYRMQQWFETCIALDPPHRFMTGSSGSFPDPVGACSAASATVPRAAPSAANGARPPASPAPREALILSGSIRKDGAIENFLVTRKRATPDSFVNPPGAYTLLMRYSNGPARLISFSDSVGSGHDQNRRSFIVVAPYDPKLKEVTIALNQGAIFSRDLSGPALSVALLRPKAGEVWGKGKQRIEWALDGHGKQTAVYIQYSPDNGASWFPLGLVRGGRRYLDVNVEDLLPSNNALVYVSAADGLNTAAAMTREGFSIKGR